MSTIRGIRCSILIVFLVLTGQVFTGQALANGLPQKLVYDPDGVLITGEGPTRVGVLEERISFDFRPPHASEPRVTVQYMLNNPTPEEEHLHVAFVTVANASDFSATWNNTPVATNPDAETYQPERDPVEAPIYPIEMHWLNPRTGKVYATWGVQHLQEQTTLFDLHIPGSSTGELVIHFYQQESGWDRADFFLHRRYHYTYLLTPARFWAFFRQLTITVHKPENMWMATEPRLEQLAPDTFEATFDGLPEGNLHISTQAKGLHFTDKDLASLGPVSAAILIILLVAFLRRKLSSTSNG